MSELLRIVNLQQLLPLTGTRKLWGRPSFVWAVDGVTLKIDKGESLGLLGSPYSGVSLVGLSIIKPFSSTYFDQFIFRGMSLDRDRDYTYWEMKSMGVFLIFSRFRYPIQPPFIQFGSRFNPEITDYLEMDLKFTSKIAKDIRLYDPKLLIADISVKPSLREIEAILSIMKEEKEERQTSSLLIAQDLGAIVKLCDKVGIMYSGKIVEYADTKTFLKSQLHPYSQSLLIYETFLEFSNIQAIPLNVKEHVKWTLSYSRRYRDIFENLVDRPRGCIFFRKCPRAMDICRKLEPALAEVDQGHFAACLCYLESRPARE